MEQNTSIELMPLIKRGEEILVDARLLHKQLNVGRGFRHWIKERIAEYGFEANKDFFTTATLNGKVLAKTVPTENDNMSADRHHPSNAKIDYSITLDMAKELAMLQQNETGRSFRRYFIVKEKEARSLRIGMEAPDYYFTGIPSETINGHKLYSFTPFMKQLGYNPENGTSHRKDNYPNHFMKIGSRLYITEAYAKHLFKSSLIIKSRKAVKAMQPLLSSEFGEPLEIK